MTKQKKGGDWSTSEVATLKRCVKEAKTNTEGFKKASNELGRSLTSCQAKFYYQLSTEKISRSNWKKESHSVQTSTGIHIFKVENDWKPTKIFNTEMDSYIRSIISTTEHLKPGQSFAIPFTELKKRYSWDKESTATNSVRHILRKNLKTEMYGRIKIHAVKDNDHKLTQIRIRRINEA